MSFGARLKSARGSLTQKELAEKIGCTESAVQLWEADKTLPSGRYIQAMAVILDIDVGSLFRESLGPAPIPARQGPSVIKDSDGLYGRTEQKEINGKKSMVTIYGEQDQARRDPFGEMVSGLREIFDGQDPVLIRAITANIEAFRDSALKNKRLLESADRIDKLETECEDIKKRLSDLEQKLKLLAPLADPEESAA